MLTNARTNSTDIGIRLGGNGQLMRDTSSKTNTSLSSWSDNETDVPEFWVLVPLKALMSLIGWDN